MASLTTNGANGAEVQLLDRIRGEFREVPDLKVTEWQACRLWNISVPVCDDILGALVAERFLRRTADGAYLRRGMERRRPVSR